MGKIYLKLGVFDDAIGSSQVCLYMERRDTLFVTFFINISVIYVSFSLYIVFAALCCFYIMRSAVN